MQAIAGDVRTNSQATFFSGHLCIDAPVLTCKHLDHLSMDTGCRLVDVYQWTIGTNGKRKVRKSNLTARLDDNDDDLEK